MLSAKLFTNGRSQAVRLPKECRLPGTEVGVKRIGELIILFPQERAEDLFYSSLGNFTDDYFESIESARMENLPENLRDHL